MYKIISRRKIWFTFSGTLVALSLVALTVWGLNFGIDFTGGSLLEVQYENNRPEISEVNKKISELNLESLVVQPSGDKNLILRFQNTEEGVHQEVLNKLEGAQELRFDAVGPSIGNELKQKSFYAIILVLIFIIIYIAFAFRKVSKPVASWKYGVTAIIALFHDTIILLGVFSVLSYFYGVEINTAFIAAVLTVLGYSVNDTIVIFDRIRENLPKSNENFEDTINTSVNQTLIRSINTSLTTALVLLSVLFFGGETITGFVSALLVGVVLGTYSSIFLASPLLVLWKRN